jgi:Zn-dependent protease with chaperone function
VSAAGFHDLATSNVPSLGRRIALSIVLLAGFYVTTLLVAGLLLPIGPLLVWAEYVKGAKVQSSPVALCFVFAGTWIPAALLVRGLFVRPPPFKSPGRLLVRDDAPELFSILDDLAQRANTHPPVEIYLCATTVLGVTERGGFFGFGSRRVLLLGAPLLTTLTVQELKAGLAHELGHYLGGDTRLSVIVGYTHALFRSVLARTHYGGQSSAPYFSFAASVSRALGGFLVNRYALWLTRPVDRQREIAADVLSATLAGRDVAIRALEKVSALTPLYDAYLANHVVFAVDHGAMPYDVIPGFETFNATIARRGLTTTLLESIHTQKTDRFDSHPSLEDRVRALQALREGPLENDSRLASALLPDRREFDKWVARATLELFSVTGRVEILPWSDLPRGAFVPSMQKRSRHLVQALRTGYPHEATAPQMLRRICHAVAHGEGPSIAAYLAPIVARFPGNRVALSTNVIAVALLVLFRGALLECGASIEPSLGEACLRFSLNGECIEPEVLVEAAMRDDAGANTLHQWAARLCATPVLGGDGAEM